MLEDIDYSSALFGFGLTSAGAVIGVLLSHFWRRFRERLVTVRYSVNYEHLATSGSDVGWGKVETRWNDYLVTNLKMCHVEMENTSRTDLTDVEVTFSFADETYFLQRVTYVVGSEAKPLPPTSEQAERWKQAAAEAQKSESPLPPEQIASLIRFESLRIPVFNRSGRAVFRFLIRPPTANNPQLLIACDHKGVKLKQSPPGLVWFGEAQNHTLIAGIPIAYAAVALLYYLEIGPLANGLIGVTLGTWVIAIGWLFIKLGRLIAKALS